MATQIQDSGSIGTSTLSVALIGPHEQRRRIVANALAGSDVTTVREFTAYPAKLNDVSRMLDQKLRRGHHRSGQRSEYALELVENIAANRRSDGDGLLVSDTTRTC